MSIESDHQYHEGSELTGLITLAGIIFGLIMVGILLFSLTWAMAH